MIFQDIDTNFGKWFDFIPVFLKSMSQKNDPFGQKKQSILKQIAQTSETNLDASPKGTLDVHLLALIDVINAHDDMVTTSSCSGRLSVFLEGEKVLSSPSTSESGISVRPEQQQQQQRDEEEEESISTSAAAATDRAKIGGKGLGGKWLYITHEPSEVVTSNWWPLVKEYKEEEVTTASASEPVSKAELLRSRRYVLYKFEAMVSFTQLFFH